MQTLQRTVLRGFLMILVLWGGSGCYHFAVQPGPMRTVWWRAHDQRPAERLLVFLPGRFDRPEDFETRGLRATLEQRWPGTDVVAVDAGLGYYLDRSVAERLEREVIQPALAHGYREVWFLGVSLGGLGALLWETENAGTARGLLLMAPFLGNDRSLFAEIEAEGGLRQWTTTERPPTENFHRLIWQRLTHDNLPSNVWMALGERDRYRPGMELLAEELPEDRVLRLPGGHTWTVWTKAFDDLLGMASSRVTE